MFPKVLITFAKSLEVPKYPLFGPNLKALYLCGLWQKRGETRNIFMNILHFVVVLFVVSQMIELYLQRQEMSVVLNNLSLTLMCMCVLFKMYTFLAFRLKWSELVDEISRTELKQIKKNDSKVMILTQKYIKYSRFISYTYWSTIFLTNVVLLITLIVKFITTSTNGDDAEGYTEIISSWFPFDNSKMPGYFYACLFHLLMSAQGSTVLASYDTNAVSVMTYLKGQLIILREMSADIFESEAPDKHHKFMMKIKECHEHHTSLIKQFRMFESLSSPVMFFYVLVCSITICSSVVQLSMKGTTSSQKLWVAQYSGSQVFQLLLFCWHANEVLIESGNVDRAVYGSDWWKADVRLRKQVLLLAGKLNQPFELSAGPFTKLSLPTFISILKGAYSSYTLIWQMQEIE